jgi:hypothetical protein
MIEDNEENGMERVDEGKTFRERKKKNGMERF